MTFKEIWNALTSDLREDLWNELTSAQRVSIFREHSQTQRIRLASKLTPELKIQADKYWVEVIRFYKIGRYLRKFKKSEYEEIRITGQELADWYHAALGHVLIFEKDVDFKPHTIKKLESEYFWKGNESIEKQKQEWDIRFRDIRLDIYNQHNNSVSAENMAENMAEEMRESRYVEPDVQSKEFCINPNNPHEDEHYVTDHDGTDEYSENENDGRNYDEC